MRKPLWKPSKTRVKNANMTRFMHQINRDYGTNIKSYPQLHQWSIDNLSDFWAAFWEFLPVIRSKEYFTVIDDPMKMPGARWFPGARLNFAENLLRFGDDQVALIGRSETGPAVRVTYAQLRDKVARIAHMLADLGIRPGDRIAGYMPNIPETVIAMLAATSLGAVWTSTSPDFGQDGVLSRFGQTKPRVLFAADGYTYNGKTHMRLESIGAIVKQLPSLEKVVVVPFATDRPDLTLIPHSVSWTEVMENHSGGTPGFRQLPADHPLYIMYSSGTTGLPKCLVQSAGGILVHHLKELVLHTDVKREDTIFYYTTCGWMMWNWLVSSLGAGATVLLYDGSPLHPDPLAMWRLVEAENVSIFGTGARYLEELSRQKIEPGAHLPLDHLKTVLSTGSPLCKEGFHWVYENVKKDVQLSSICGGTDLNGCLAIGNPTLPVYPGELQCRPLGMATDSFDENGEPVRDAKGELVCSNPFPSMPLGLWGDDDGSRYQAAYFDRFPGVWAHGDYVMIRGDTGGLIVFGRSDTTLNPGGVRIGTAELYPAVESVNGVEDSLVVGQDWGHDTRIILFVKLREGVALDDELVGQIRKSIIARTTRRHLPAKILPVSDIPYTISGKKVELAVRNIIHDEPVTNRDALRNPQCLEMYKDLPALHS